jgi:long-chain fatty acid transport protein
MQCVIRGRAALIGLAICGAFASHAAAGGFMAARFGSEHGHATTSHPSAIYYNPAGLALGVGTRVCVEGLFGYRDASYERPAGAIDNVIDAGDPAAGTPTDAVAANAGEARLFNSLAVPFVAIVSDFGVEGLGIGLGAYLVFGGHSDWDRNDAFADSTTYPGAVDGIQRWSSIEGSIRSGYVTLGGAYTIEPARLSVGVGLNLVLSNIDTIRARLPQGTDDLAAGDIALEGRSRLDVTDATYSIGAGVIWQPVDDVWVGASYQSQPSFGDMTLDGTLTNKFAGGGPTDTEITVAQGLPDVVRAGARWRPTDVWELRLFGDFVRWSTLDSHCGVESGEKAMGCKVLPDGSQDPDGGVVAFNIDRDWNNTFGVRAGASHWLRRDVEVFVGGGYDSSAVPDDTLDPALIDMDKVSAAVGGRFELLDERMALTTSWLQVFYFDRTVEPREMAAATPTRTPDTAGTYKQSVGLFSLGAEYTF